MSGPSSAPPDTAERLLTDGQRLLLGGLVLLLLLGALVAPRLVLQVVVGGVSLLYVAVAVHRLVLVVRGAGGDCRVRVEDAKATAMRDDLLPSYTVLVPAYREPEVVGELLTALERLDYPRDRLQVLLLLEADDDLTADAVRAAGPGPGVTVVTVPSTGPRTKPNACNHGLSLATGRLLTIYDVEDRPEPLQLRRAAVAFEDLPSDVACLQARLAYHNAGQNRITQWFTNEYDVWFSYYLPGLVATDAPVPLGGTSNHIRTEVLRELGGWDAHNVTEDADLGVRLHRRGWRTRVLDSVTEEEANSDFVNWVKQRSRWYKGYLTTWVVHSRAPRTLLEQTGWRGFTGFHLFIGGTPLLAALNPMFWALTCAWLALGADAVSWLFVPPVYHLSLLAWAVGTFVPLYVGLYAARDHDRPELTAALLLVPLYWVMMSLAAVKAVLQLVRQPAYWEKTVHGLDRGRLDVAR